ncbi:MAG: EAL domain-containing protein [Phormidesmis sp. RL_2_1]|nr:EAL domain-containing protein [Phormidesmis sp. RL_2_1]
MVTKNIEGRWQAGAQFSFKSGIRLVKSWEKICYDCRLSRAIALSSITAALTIVLAQLSVFQLLEIKAFDVLTQLTARSTNRPTAALANNNLVSNSRVVVVAITEEDIQAQKQWPLSDDVFARLLAKLQTYSPAVIGLAIYRDIPYAPGSEALARQLQQANVVTIRKLGLSGDVEVPSPPALPESQVGFNDFVIDPDGVIRRNFMFAATENQRYYSFSLRLVEQFLAGQKIKIFPEADAINLGHARIKSITPTAGGYQTIDARGYQALMRYFSPDQLAQELSLSQVLSGEFDPEWIAGKVVLIGTTAPSGKDLYYTPFSTGFSTGPRSAQKENMLTSGVVLHAQMTQQMLSTVLDGRAMLSVWPQQGEFIWIWIWGLAGGLIAWRFNHPSVIAIAMASGLAALFAITLGVFSQAVWIPFTIPAITFILSGGGILFYKEFRKTFYDSISGLPNRTRFTQELQTLFKQHTGRFKEGRSHLSVAVILLNIDQFRAFNESLGLQVGDRLLQLTAQRLQQALLPLPKGNTRLAHIAVDEFVVVLDQVAKPEDALAIGQMLQHKMAQPMALAFQKVFPTVSVGIVCRSYSAIYPVLNRAITAETLLRDAQTALSRAKADGHRGRCEVFVSNMRTQLSHRLGLEADLRDALSQQAFLLYYQPLICLKTMTLAGFEALIRWQHPQRGMISPGEFIPVAEDTGLITPIGQWVLEVACAQAQRWRQKFPQNPPFMSVNLSGRQFEQHDLVEQIGRILQESDLEPSALKLELTESTVMNQRVEESITMLERLKALGIQLGIDDFGTGYSSLSYLHRFPIDTLKVDRSFVMEMDIPQGTAELVKTIIALGHNLGMTVVAEGIETVSQSQTLRALQCEYGQGYLYAKPLPASAAEDLLKTAGVWKGEAF